MWEYQFKTSLSFLAAGIYSAVLAPLRNGLIKKTLPFESFLFVKIGDEPSENAQGCE